MPPPRESWIFALGQLEAVGHVTGMELGVGVKPFLGIDSHAAELLDLDYAAAMADPTLREEDRSSVSTNDEGDRNHERRSERQERESDDDVQHPLGGGDRHLVGNGPRVICCECDRGLVQGAE